jgi:hypothetical protein
MNTSHFAVLLLLASCSRSQAADTDIYVISCPATIETTQNLRSPAPTAWSEVANVEVEDTPRRWNNTHWLSGASFSTGHPSNLFILAPDNSNESRHRRKFTSYWTFYDTAGVYVSCSYAGTTVQLTQQIPAGYKRCEVSYEKDATGNSVSISCSRPRA